jgi:hypothetical protein
VRCKGVQEGIAIELAVAVDADFQRTVAERAGNAEDDVAIVDLAVVERHLRPLVDLAADQPARAAYTAAIPASIGKVDALVPQAVQQRHAMVDLERHTTAIGERYAELRHIQMSLVQSPPG